jgi:D-alanyl-D-alanine carboxypeptidase.
MRETLVRCLIWLFCLISLPTAAQNSAQNTADAKDYIVDFLNQYLQDSAEVDAAVLHAEWADAREHAAPLTTSFSSAWTDWSVVENYAFGIDRGTIAMIADLNALHPAFRDKVTELIRLCRLKGIEVAVVETFRTHAKQNEYKGMGGGTYTNSVGGRSKHQYGLAVDIVPIVNGKPQWKNQTLWRKVGVIGESLGLRWGGRWKRPYDPAHFEWSGGLTSKQLAEGMLPPVSEDAYPCIHEDITDLRARWKEWEAFQSMSY